MFYGAEEKRKAKIICDFHLKLFKHTKKARGTTPARAITQSHNHQAPLLIAGCKSPIETLFKKP